MVECGDARQHPRWKADQALTIELLGTHPAKGTARLVDVSRTGMRIRCAFSASAGTPVAITIGNDLILGEVVWCAGEEIGISLEQLLDMGHLERLRWQE